VTDQTAIADVQPAPGRWPVCVRICSVTSCRSNSVRPHDGQLTYSVFVFRILEPCAMHTTVVMTRC